MERKKLLPGQQASEPLQIDTKAVHQFVLQCEKEFSSVLLPIDEEEKQNNKKPRIYYPHLIVEIPVLPYSEWNIWCKANTEKFTLEVTKKIDTFVRNFSLLDCAGLILAPKERKHEHSIGVKSFQQYRAFIKDNGKNPFFDFRVYNVSPELTKSAYGKENEYVGWMMLNDWRGQYNLEYCKEKGITYDYDREKFFQWLQSSLSTNDWKALNQNNFDFREKYIRKNLCEKPVNFLLSHKPT